MSSKPTPSPRLAALIAQLEAPGPALTSAQCGALLAGAELTFDDVVPYVRERTDACGRRRVARTDALEMVVMTWRPAQGSVPHHHAGSSCTVRVMRGDVKETLFRLANDGLVDEGSSRTTRQGETVEDPGTGIHLL